MSGTKNERVIEEQLHGAPFPSRVMAAPATTDEVQALREEIAVLRAQIAWLKQRLFGPGKGETLDRAQLLLQLGELEKLASHAPAPRPAATITYERTGGPAPKRTPPAESFAHLPVKEIVEIVPEPVQAEPDLYERIGEERTFEVDVVPPQLFKREIVRPKYRHRLDRHRAPLLAPAPKRPVTGGFASAGLVAWALTAKYADHRVPRAPVVMMSHGRCAATQPMRETKAPRDRLTGAGLKSPLAAVDKSHGRERRRKRPVPTGQMGDREMNASEPSLTCRNVYQLRSKPGGCGCPGIEQGRSLFRTLRPPASRWHEPVTRRLCGTWEPSAPMPTERLKQKPCESLSREAAQRDGTVRSSVEGLDKGHGAKGLCSGGWLARSTGNGRNR